MFLPGYDLTSTEISHTNNIFTSFIYGIARGPFPFTISLRSQSENILVFDDLLSLSPCHVNVIPSDVYLRDSRALFCRPVEVCSSPSPVSCPPYSMVCH